MNRTSVVLCLLLFLVPLAPSGLAQAEAPLLEDASGDVAVYTDAGSQPADGRFAALDLVSASVLETPDDFVFALGVASLTAEDESPQLESGEVDLAFTHQDRDYRVVIYRTHETANYYGAALNAYDPGEDQWDWIASVDYEVDEDAALYHVTVDRDLLRDGDGAAPFPGRSLTAFHASSRGYYGSMSVCVMECVRPDLFQDHMPDSGVGGGYAVEYGIAQTGHARLFSQTPMRASNGEATTIVFEVEAKNLGGTADRFTLAAGSVPSAWSVRLPVPVVDVEAGASVKVPVIASLPFNHQHGATQTFLVTSTSDRDPSAVGRIELGVHFTDVPQPSGHHDTLYLHTRDPYDNGVLEPVMGAAFPYNYGSFNTLLDDEADQGLPLESHYACTVCIDDDGTVYNSWTWWVGLSPGLQMGLDFDLSRTGHLTLPFQTDGPMTGVQVFTTLRHWTSQDGEEWDDTPVFTAEETIGDVTGGPFGIDLDWTPLEEADYLPYTEHQSLVLAVQVRALGVSSFGTGTISPKLAPGGLMQLPLNEYKDPVDTAFTSLADLLFTAEGPQEKAVNPGETVILRSRLTNGMDHHMALDLDLSGSNDAWAALLSPTVVHLEAGESKVIEVAVVAPEDARDGDAADLILAAAAQGDASMRTLVRLVADVDSTVDHEDEAAAAMTAEVHDTPGFGVVPWAAAALALLALRKRR